MYYLQGFFQGHSLTQFVRHCAEHYLSSEHKEIRMEAVRTCALLLTPLLSVSSLSDIITIKQAIATAPLYVVLFQ